MRKKTHTDDDSIENLEEGPHDFARNRSVHQYILEFFWSCLEALYLPLQLRELLLTETWSGKVSARSCSASRLILEIKQTLIKIILDLAHLRFVRIHGLCAFGHVGDQELAQLTLVTLLSLSAPPLRTLDFVSSCQFQSEV